MDNILITGEKGQLGTELSKLLPNAFLTDINELDITNKDAVDKFVKKHKIETIINCAAYTNVDKAEDDSKVATSINVIGPTNLASTGCKMIHISTDYVFDGMQYKPYTTEDKTHPLSVYGKTKRLGEEAVLMHSNKAIIIRTAWLYSPYGNNFVKTMLRLGQEKKEINVVSDQVGSPTYAADLAKAIVQILPHMEQYKNRIYHFTNEGICSWYDFAYQIMKESHLKCQVNPIPTELFPTKAKRPSYSVLDKSAIKRDFGIQIPHWQDGLQRCLKQMEKVR